MHIHTPARRALPLTALLTLLSLVTSTQALACAACGCTLSSDIDTLGLSTGNGWHADLRYDVLNQNQLRSGTGTISGAKAAAMQHDGDPMEVERYTDNQYATLGLDYSPDGIWGLNLQLPYIHRHHSTLGTASDGVTPGPGGEQYESTTSSLGDARLVVRYQGLLPEHNLGLTLGLKLPTGRFHKTGTSTDPTEPGPADIDRGLQPGTGTTDLLLGAFYLGEATPNWGYFAQAAFQTALGDRAQYRPGSGVNLNVGVHYDGWADWTPQLQLNVRRANRDSGEAAEAVSTGGTLAYLSPGLSWHIRPDASLYGFVQLPIYQRVNGVQLAPKVTASLGARFAF